MPRVVCFNLSVGGCDVGGDGDIEATGSQPGDERETKGEQYYSDF